MKRIIILISVLLICAFGTFSIACDQLVEFDYNIDFVVDGEVIATVGTNGDKISMPKNPTKEDYTFEGWYWDEGEWDEEFTLNSILDQPLQDRNHYKVYAKFKSSVYYTVIFSNYSEKITQQIKYGEPTALRLNTFIPDENYVFDSWRSYDNVYQDGEVVLNLCEVGETIRLYPNWVWDHGSYTVVFKANGGSGNMANQTLPRNEYSKLSINMFIREHYTFAGWSKTADGVGPSYEDEESVYNLAEKRGTIILYAQWVYNDVYDEDQSIASDSYTVRYLENNGTMLYEKKMSVGVDGIIHCLAYQTPESYVFVGWNTKADGTGTLYENGTYITGIKTGQTIVLYAQYKKIENEMIDGVYYVDDYTDLLLMKNNLNGTYVLIQDIVLPNEMLSIVFECGTPTSPFNGRFFGNGYTISSTLITSSYEKENYCGLFGYIGENGWVQDLHLALNIDGWDYGATFARCNQGTIVNCSATGQVSMGENEFQRKDLYVGGIVVFNEGTIKNTFSAVFIGGTTLIKNIQMAGICIKNTGTIENCIYLRETKYVSVGGYKYNEYTSFQIDGLMCLNEGTSTNNYYFNDIKYEIKKGSYVDEMLDETYESGKVISLYGAGANSNQINTRDFYVDTLGWSEDVWDFSDLDYNNWKYPILKKQ